MGRTVNDIRNENRIVGHVSRYFFFLVMGPHIINRNGKELMGPSTKNKRNSVETVHLSLSIFLWLYGGHTHIEERECRNLLCPPYINKKIYKSDRKWQEEMPYNFFFLTVHNLLSFSIFNVIGPWKKKFGISYSCHLRFLFYSYNRMPGTPNCSFWSLFLLLGVNARHSYKNIKKESLFIHFFIFFMSFYPSTVLSFVSFIFNCRWMGR